VNKPFIAVMLEPNKLDNVTLGVIKFDADKLQKEALEPNKLDSVTVGATILEAVKLLVTNDDEVKMPFTCSLDCGVDVPIPTFPLASILIASLPDVPIDIVLFKSLVVLNPLKSI
jgi:hypothetical protein